ncbi:MAG: YhjD/YihY/BrkB family envelope integrity protein, partial [Thermodesulfobacteriota bacterium]
MGKFGAKKERFLSFFTTGLWGKRLGELSWREAIFLRPLRIVVLALKGFLENKCTLRASALTFYSLLAIVPVLAMIFGIAKGFGLRQRLRSQLLESFSGQEEVLTRAIDFADKLLDTTSGGAVAGIGVIVLLWSVIKVLGHIEESFNVIWEVKTER